MYVYRLGSKIFEHFTGWEKCTLLFKEHLLALSVPTLQRWVQLSTFTSSVCHGDIFYLTDHSQLTLAPAQASVSTPPSNTQSYPSAHLALSTFHHLSLHCFYPRVPSSSFFLPVLFHLPLAACLKMFFRNSSPQVYKGSTDAAWVSLCWSRFDSLQSSFFQKRTYSSYKWHRRASVSDRAQEGLILFPGPTSECPSAYFPLHQVWPTSPVVHVFHKTVLIKGISLSIHSQRIKVPLSLLPIFSCS